MALNICLDVSVDNVCSWKVIGEKEGEVNTKKTYVTRDET
jgi:hypothetical protein